MRIGLIADTHIPDVDVLPLQVEAVFSEVDLILHAGDVYVRSVLDELAGLAPVLAAKGDDDYLLNDRRVKEQHLLTIEDTTILLVHRRPVPWLLVSTSLKDVRLPNGLNRQRAIAPDIVVFGHTHEDAIEYSEEGILFVNPGSPTFPNHAPNHVQNPGTVAILTITAGKVHAEIVQLT